MEKVVDSNRHISDALESLRNRITAQDYLNANHSCPTWMPGVSKYQFVGPDHEYSTCYYVEHGYVTLIIDLASRAVPFQTK